MEIKGGEKHGGKERKRRGVVKRKESKKGESLLKEYSWKEIQKKDKACEKKESNNRDKLRRRCCGKEQGVEN